MPIELKKQQRSEESKRVVHSEEEKNSCLVIPMTPFSSPDPEAAESITKKMQTQRFTERERERERVVYVRFSGWRSFVFCEATYSQSRARRERRERELERPIVFIGRPKRKTG